MDQDTVGNDVAVQLFEAEEAVDLAMARVAKLMETMMCARKQIDLSASAGQGAVRRIADAMSGLGGVRGGLVLAHTNLEQLGASLGMEVEASGGGMKPSDSPHPAFLADRRERPLAAQ